MGKNWRLSLQQRCQFMNFNMFVLWSELCPASLIWLNKNDFSSYHILQDYFALLVNVGELTEILMYVGSFLVKRQLKKFKKNKNKTENCLNSPKILKFHQISKNFL